MAGKLRFLIDPAVPLPDHVQPPAALAVPTGWVHEYCDLCLPVASTGGKPVHLPDASVA